MSDAKITDSHRRRRAVVYVRQSTVQQLERNHESRARQYALRERAIELGWPAGAVTVVDDDLGRSGASTEGRLGFRELVAEVGLGQVGLILSLESSRLARSSADWHQLLDLCALTGTLIADTDGIYSPQDFNDRLLLGLKGTMSEAELHLIRARLTGGLRNKANRGELALNLPVGLDRDEDGRIVLAADEQVRHAIGRVFELWRQLSSARQIVGELRAEGQQLPRRTVGSRRVRWQPATYGAVHDFLTNPVYAGAFVFGRSRTEKRLDPTGKVRTKTITLPLEQWSVCLPEHHPGYVSWPDYLQTRERLRANVILPGEGSGAPREGDALLQGLLRCGRCGRRMQVTYSGNSGRIVRYSCVRAHQLHGAGHACQSVGGHRLEKAVTAAFLDAVTPAGLRVSADAIEELNQQHDARMHGQRLAVERAEYEAERARRQFDACEPEHRLVARTLEARLESTLSDLERERRRLAELEQRRPQPLTPDERRALTTVARNLPRLWNAPSTSSHDRKALLRCLLIDVIVTIRDEPRQAELELQWEGGAHTDLTVALIHRGPESKRTDEDTLELVRRLAAHQADRHIAAILNKQGRQTGTGLPFTAARVHYLRVKHHIPAAPPPDPNSDLFTIDQAANELGVTPTTIYRWLRDGLLAGQQTTPGAAWRIRLDPDTRAKFVPDVPDGYLPLDQAAKALGVARQTVLHKVQRGELTAIQVTQGRRNAIQVSGGTLGLLDQ